MIQESVVAVINNDVLGDILPIVHRSGYGHLARVIRNTRRSLLGQLQRAGVPVSQAPETITQIPAVLLISAAGRAPMAATMLIRLGANRVWIVSADGVWSELEDTVLSQPNVHALPAHPIRSLHQSPAAPPQTTEEHDQHPR